MFMMLPSPESKAQPKLTFPVKQTSPRISFQVNCNKLPVTHSLWSMTDSVKPKAYGGFITRSNEQQP